MVTGALKLHAQNHQSNLIKTNKLGNSSLQ